jgi:hypothetical protein
VMAQAQPKRHKWMTGTSMAYSLSSDRERERVDRRSNFKIDGRFATSTR